MKTCKQRSRADIEKDFVDVEHTILKMSLAEAILRNQRLMLETFLDIRDQLHSRKS